MGIENNQGYTAIDDTIRCPKCCVETKQGRAGTPLSEITVSVSSTCEPFIAVAKATICRRCRRIYRIFILPMGEKLNINRHGVGCCLKASRNSDMFKINELQSGEPDKLELSESLKKILADMPEKNKPVYNPNEFTEQDLPGA